jgi:hypothetical protein
MVGNIGKKKFAVKGGKNATKNTYKEGIEVWKWKLMREAQDLVGTA